ncbi:MAG: UDP-N-acetylglucosamine 1-carboxyvinyltransferase [Alphaproteobacteria bacterium MarineAlpha5_Bin5]|nr:MAG: UDP-N-acetylglucosamine 1-carboxyvinyltransferase [Alphaproteobacteria bacterium MarineAlpha5_Bin5]PPR51940.1 MAG: UDP-N-acetylglucosamine 1-carboxyvinyltransferase [Alphaproteobacteria bacterium MarineAlpha5_Bin4]|tara:strand:- start:22652 stop:23908 length:1257 start_codon:yes stop_codon:yes gene_type:complete
MDRLIISGNAKLYGSINVKGSKNSALPLMAASLLSNKDLILQNLPNLEDVNNMQRLLQAYGVIADREDSTIHLNAKKVINRIADYDVVRKMRASILILGPLLSKFGEAKISLPGGCAIGNRPIDIHIQGLRKLGATFEIENGFVIGRVKDSLVGNNIKLSFPSVGATENILMAAVLAIGKTVIINAAKEPEITDLAKCLNLMGAKINGAGTDIIEIEGVESLNKTSHKILSDRIVAGTFIIAAVMLNKNFKVCEINPKHLDSLINILKKMGANIKIKNTSIEISPSKNLKGILVKTSPYPGFPTDLQAQMMALMSIVKGNSQIKETIFENRFMHVPELNRLGANIKIIKDVAYIQGNRKFVGAQVMASDLRASVSLVLAGICAKGKTVINRVYHLDRGYEKIEKTLGNQGPKIKREKI